MYEPLFAQFIRKANLVLFGKHPVIVSAIRDIKNPNYFPCEYVHERTSFFFDPCVKNAMDQIPHIKGNCYIIFVDEFDAQVKNAVYGRPHIKPGVVVWSMCIKLIWKKVKLEHKNANPNMLFEDTMLTPEEITGCLPRNFEFPENTYTLSKPEIVEEIFRHETSGYKTELGPSLDRITPINVLKEGILKELVEAAVISQIAVRCNGEVHLLQFLKNCCDLVLSKRYAS